MSLLWLVQKDLWAAAIILIPVVVPTTNNPIYDEFVDGWQNTAAIYGTEYQAAPQHFQTLRTLTSMTHHVLRVMLEHEAHKQ